MYFFHEDPEDRIHRPHPFHTAEKEAQRACDVESLARSTERTEVTAPSSAPDRRAPTAPTPISAPPGEFPMLQAAKGHPLVGRVWLLDETRNPPEEEADGAETAEVHRDDSERCAKTREES